MAAPKHCYRHPDRETRLTCATCGRPICTECMRQTDVGIKCPDDARLPRGARAGVMKSSQILRAVGAGVGVALAGTLVAYIILQIGFGSIILSGLAGYGAGTVIYRAGGYNGGPIAMTISAAAVLIAFAPWVLPALLAGVFGLGVVLGPLIAVAVALYASRG
ncbi:B-box zinc finger protein [Rubrobacter aplysinae]|uniref:hypothetical protein n=1 Tax=Rubrobacter aplysinae TaxID=909625 RepID=UPI00069DBF2D|nr:hypothetical protein [Rubrobacter aplysinae]